MKQRKYSAYLITLAVISGGVWIGVITGAEYTELVKLCLSVFVLGNVGEHIANRSK